MARSQASMASRRRRKLRSTSSIVVCGAAAAAVAVVGVGGYTTSLRRSDLAGVWRLTSQQSFLPQGVARTEPSPKVLQYPMKEFTVYPKKTEKRTIATTTALSKDESTSTTKQQELLLMLSDDGCFVQYGLVPDPSSSSKESNDAKNSTSAMLGMVSLTKGVWDYRDGKLILAADRPKDADPRRVHDTILVGEVVACTEESLDGEGAMAFQEEEEEEGKTKKTEQPKPPLQEPTKTTLALTEDEERTLTAAMDVRLSVPKGSVEIGKFFYPKSHPSFFDQPIFKPMPTGSFQLRQVLGALNAKSTTASPDVPVERFKKKDLVGKRFFLTSYPLRYGNKPSKGKKRWSIKYQKMVEETKSAKQLEKERQEEENKPLPIAVMKIQLFQNNTFSSIGGLGSSIILRGKWSIIGHDRDQFWMKVWRFGFGRSVSGSVYSEGKSLTQDDEKGYWGQIVEVDNKTKKKKQSEGDKDHASTEKDFDDKKPKAVEINGSVILGFGLEPLPVARFTMREAMDEEEEDDDDDDDWDPDEDALEKSFRQDEVGSDGSGGGGNIDISTSWSDNAFQ